MESGLLDSTTGNTNSFQENLKDKMAAIRKPGSDIGIVTRINAPNFEQPSISAAFFKFFR